jgi:hypothetical protein
MSVSLVSYATGKFLPLRAELNESAIKWGIPQHFNYGREDLEKTSYYQANRNILDEPCGAGFWAWKPFFILEALRQLEENAVLFYCDAGSLFMGDPAPLVKICTNHPRGLVLFDARPLTNRQFTKRDCFVRLQCDSEAYWDAPKVIATLLVVRNCRSAREFLLEWLKFCQDRAAISSDPSGQRELRGFLQHRWDQSILSVLTAKHEIETYRNPTVWGNFLKLPAHRVAGEQIVAPYGIPPAISDYSATPQTNSPYGTLFVINRLPNFEHKPHFRPRSPTGRIKDVVKFILRKIGLRKPAHHSSR